MPANTWQITNRASAGAAATASQAAPGAALNGGAVVRLRSLQAAISGTGAGTDLLVVRDGASGAGAIIWSLDMAMPANDTQIVQVTGLDLRASVGNALTVEFVSGVSSDRENVNAQGDFIPQGWPFGQS